MCRSDRLTPVTGHDPFAQDLVRRLDSIDVNRELLLAGISLELSLDGITPLVGEPFDSFAESVQVEFRPPPLSFVVAQEVAHDRGGVDGTR